MTDPNPPQFPRPKLTDLAVKYNHPVGGRHDDLYGSKELKSGLTPLNLGPFDRYEDTDNFQRWKRYQLDRFEGFVTNELDAMEALAPLCHDGQLPALDDVPIHPLLVRKQWNMKIGKHQAPYPIKRGNSGFWHAANDEVWNTMVPALKIASLYLTDGPLLVWIDALLFGQLEPISKDEIPDEQDFHTRQFYRIRRRRLEVVKSQQQRVLEKLTSVAKNVEFGLVSGMNDAVTGLPDSAGITLGKTVFNMTWYDKTKIFLAIEMVEALLRTDLTAAERAVETFRLSSIITHEIAHMLWLERSTDRVTRHTDVDEPYFENEVCAELGFSFHNALLGGIPHEVVSMENPRPEFGLPAAGIYRSSWENLTFHNYNRYSPTLINLPQNYFQRDRWPVPVGFFMDLCQQKYWETFVKKYGQKATRMGPLTEGSREQFLPSADHRRRRLSEHKPVPPNMAVDHNMSGAHQTTVRFYNQRNTRARRIQNKLEAYRDNLNAIEEIQRDRIFPGQALLRPPELSAGEPSCARYAEIRDHLFANRLELALDTLNFKMPGHVMFAHILRNGGLDISADEWWSFLEVCEFHKVLFKHIKLGTGCIERIPAGWPTTPLRERPGWPKPERSIREHFLVVARSALTVPYVFVKGYLDHDKNQFRQICIASKANFTPMPDKKRICELDPVTFEALLYWCHQEKHLFTYGPEGVIRLLKRSNSPIDPTPVIENKKGIRSRGKRCPQM